jgi:lipoate-protein ligase A
MDARLIINAPAPGPWNMAVDELLFRAAMVQRVATVRIYSWSPPTLTLGYFQSVADRQRHRASRHLPLVRRATGGGAIVHDQEVTYSLALPLAGERPQLARDVMATVHTSLVALFAERGIELCRWCRPASRTDGTSPFLCFQRRAPDDLLLGDQKVVGSAQRRQHAALLQHGSILLRRSAAAPELPGIEDLAATETLAEWFVERWPENLARALAISLQSAQLSSEERDGVQRIAAEKYAALGWNEKR